MTIQKITPFLWFDDQAEEAAKFYTSIFRNSKIGRIARYSKETAEHVGKTAGSAMTVEFELDGQQFVGLNGGPMFKFTEAVSFAVQCESQDEVDFFWEKLSDGGEKSRCGWLEDKFGLSWQVVPTMLIDLMHDPARGEKAMGAVMEMDKIDIATVRRAVEGK